MNKLATALCVVLLALAEFSTRSPKSDLKLSACHSVPFCLLSLR